MTRMRGQDTMRSACKYYARTGSCRYGDNCRFAHELPQPAPELRQWCSAGKVCTVLRLSGAVGKSRATAPGLASFSRGEAFLAFDLCGHGLGGVDLCAQAMASCWRGACRRAA